MMLVHVQCILPVLLSAHGTAMPMGPSGLINAASPSRVKRPTNIVHGWHVLHAQCVLVWGCYLAYEHLESEQLESDRMQ